MGSSGTPDAATVWMCAELDKIMSSRKLSPARVLVAVYEALDEDDPLILTFNEEALGRLRRGKTVKVPRRLVEALCTALQCSAEERARVLLAGGQSVLGLHGPTADRAEVLLACGMNHLHRKAHGLIAQLIQERGAERLTAREWLEIIRDVITVTLEDRSAC